MRYGFAASEGYPSWEAVRNYLIRDGEIVIRLPDGLEIVSAECSDTRGNVQIDKQTVITKIGYAWCTITVLTEIDGITETIRFNPQKLNNWNRIIFIPVDPANPQSEFVKFENGIKKTHYDVTRKFNSEQAGSEQPATRSELDFEGGHKHQPEAEGRSR